MDDHYWLLTGSEKRGPYTLAQLRSMWCSGAITADARYWQRGLDEWSPISIFESIFDQPFPVPASTPSAEPTTPPIPTSPVRISHASSVTIGGPKGVGGWLMFFCIGLTILSPLLSLAHMFGTWAMSEPAFVLFPTIKTVLLWENSGSIVILICGFVVGCSIWSGNPHGRSIARTLLLIRLWGFIGVELIAMLMMSDLPKDIVARGLGGAVGPVFGEAFYFLIWWSYFKKSKRVRNTYGEERA